MDAHRHPGDPRVPASSQCVLRELLEAAAQRHPDRVFARFANGDPDWTYGGLRADVIRTAHALRRLGVRQGERVLCWLETGRLAIRCWLALNYLGATFVPLNLAYRGNLLAHAVQLADARLMIASAELLSRLDTPGPALRTVVAVGAWPAAVLCSGLELLPQQVLDGDEGSDGLPEPSVPIEPWDCPAIVFTSGTTGPSKAVLTSYAHLWAAMIHSPYQTGAGDCTLLHLPLFHVAGTSVVYRAISTGSCVGVVTAFRTQTFWRDVRRTGATFANIMGSIASFLLGLPATEDERETPLRHAILSPLNADCLALARRVGFDYHTVFNMTEVSRPLVSPINPGKPGICGRPRTGVEVRIVDEHDCEVSDGASGELIVRTDAPWAMFSGYFGNPEATAAAWRNGWFHTGDGFYRDADGDYVFVDRIKDAIRRRGENISSAEVEAEVLAFPGVLQCAAVAVPSPHGEDDVLLVIETQQSLDPQELIRFLLPRMPHYMVPRYVRFAGELPRTETQRIKKAELRRLGVTADTWDREAAGVPVKRSAG